MTVVLVLVSVRVGGVMGPLGLVVSLSGQSSVTSCFSQ